MGPGKGDGGVFFPGRACQRYNTLLRVTFNQDVPDEPDTVLEKVPKSMSIALAAEWLASSPPSVLECSALTGVISPISFSRIPESWDAMNDWIVLLYGTRFKLLLFLCSTLCEPKLWS